MRVAFKTSVDLTLGTCEKLALDQAGYLAAMSSRLSCVRVVLTGTVTAAGACRVRDSWRKQRGAMVANNDFNSQLFGCFSGDS